MIDPNEVRTPDELLAELAFEHVADLGRVGARITELGRQTSACAAVVAAGSPAALDALRQLQAIGRQLTALGATMGHDALQLARRQDDVIAAGIDQAIADAMDGQT